MGETATRERTLRRPFRRGNLPLHRGGARAYPEIPGKLQAFLLCPGTEQETQRFTKFLILLSQGGYNYLCFL